MNQQVVIEILELLGQRSVDFTDPLTVKMSPHSHPVIVEAVCIENREVLVQIAGEAKHFDSVPLPVRQTVGQRLRYMASKSFH